MGLRQSNDLPNFQLSLPKLPQNILDPTFCHFLEKIIFQKHSTCFKPLLSGSTGSNILVPSMLQYFGSFKVETEEPTPGDHQRIRLLLGRMAASSFPKFRYRADCRAPGHQPKVVLGIIGRFFLSDVLVT